MRKYLIGMGVWNKRDMIPWLVSGLSEHARGAAEIAVVFDSCVDGSEARFDEVSREITGPRVTKMRSRGEELNEIGVDDVLMHYFVNDTDCDALVVLHDDQRLTGPMLLQLDGALDEIGEDAGFIGGRDGYHPNLRGMVSSEWSESTLAERRLRDGEWARRPLVNPAPLVWTRRAIERVGRLNREFEAFYWWNDYAHRCILAGLTNAIMGTPITHMKFGGVPKTKYVGDGSQARDAARVERIWGRIGLAD